MNKYDYITATIEDEKVRLEKIIAYLKNSSSDELPEYQERYNNILKYLTAKEAYFNIENNIKDDRKKLEELSKVKDEYEVDNILLEDTLLSKFHDDTRNVYRNLLYENIKNQDSSIRDILYLLFEKQSNYNELVIKRNRLKSILDENKFPNTYSTLLSQGILIEKQSSILDGIFLIENNIKIEEDKQKEIADKVMTTPILKILYEFWIVDSYDKNKVSRSQIFKDNRTLVSIKNSIPEIKEPEIKKEEESKEKLLPNLNLPGVNEDMLIDIDGKNYVK